MKHEFQPGHLMPTHCRVYIEREGFCGLPASHDLHMPQAEDRWENRFIETEITCKHCEGWGSRLEDAMEIRKCNAPGCRGGSIYTALCSRCGKDENGCQCNVEDFK